MESFSVVESSPTITLLCFAFLSATLRMNRDRHMMGLDVDHESPQFEIIAQRFVQQAASV